jgi:hypothetical protein
MAQLLSRKLSYYNQTLPPSMASNKILVQAVSSGIVWFKFLRGFVGKQ